MGVYTVNCIVSEYVINHISIEFVINCKIIAQYLITCKKIHPYRTYTNLISKSGMQSRHSYRFIHGCLDDRSSEREDRHHSTILSF